MQIEIFIFYFDSHLKVKLVNRTRFHVSMLSSSGRVEAELCYIAELFDWGSAKHSPEF